MSAKPPPLTPEAVLGFWFAEGRPPPGVQPRWFDPDQAFDDAIRQRFGAAADAAVAGAYGDWAAAGPDSALALSILLDQFPRNLYRGTAAAFAGDARARRVTEAVLAAGWHLRLSPLERWFVYLPLMHAEDPAAQGRMLALYDNLPPHPGRELALWAARRHREIIARFGRFPHRNAALGRATTADEAAFVAEQGRGF